MNLKEKNKVTNVWCASFYGWVIWWNLVRSWSVVSVLEKQRIHVGGLLMIPSRWDGPLLRGAVGHFVSWPMEGQSSTSRSGWGYHRGPVSTGGGFSPAGENWDPLFSFPLKYSVCETVKDTDPNSLLLQSRVTCLNICHKKTVQTFMVTRVWSPWFWWSLSK